MPEITPPPQEEIEITVPGGGKASFKGAQTFCAFLLLFLAGTVYYGFYYLRESIASVSQQVVLVQQSIKQSDETQRTIIYVLSLSQAERERLNLARPKMLNEMGR